MDIFPGQYLQQTQRNTIYIQRHAIAENRCLNLRWLVYYFKIFLAYLKLDLFVGRIYLFL